MNTQENTWLSTIPMVLSGVVVEREVYGYLLQALLFSSECAKPTEVFTGDISIWRGVLSENFPPTIEAPIHFYDPCQHISWKSYRSTLYLLSAGRRSSTDLLLSLSYEHMIGSIRGPIKFASGGSRPHHGFFQAMVWFPVWALWSRLHFCCFPILVAISPVFGFLILFFLLCFFQNLLLFLLSWELLG